MHETHPGCVVDSENAADDIFLQIGRDKLHLQGAETMEAVLRPILRTQLEHTVMDVTVEGNVHQQSNMVPLNAFINHQIFTGKGEQAYMT